MGSKPQPTQNGQCTKCGNPVPVKGPDYCDKCIKEIINR